MQKLQDSVFSIIKTTNLSPAVFSFLQPTEDFTDITPFGGILRDTKLGWLALGPKFCVVDLRSGLKVAARTFGAGVSNSRISVSNVIELPTPLTENSHQLVISLDYDNGMGMICVLHVNGSQLLHSIHTDVVVTKLAICDATPDGPFAAFDNIVAAGTKRGEILIFDLNRASLIKALKDISQGYEHLVLNEENAANIKFLPLKDLHKLEEQRDLALENKDHLGFILNEDSTFDGQYIFHNPDGSVRMKAKRDHIRVTSLQYIPEIASLAVGFNFGAFQLWNLLTLDLEFTSQVNVECLPVTHFGFQEPCDDPKAFCYLWVVFSVIDRFEEEEFPLAVLYSLSYQGKRILSESKYLYQDFSSATIRFQIELNGSEQSNSLIGGRCISCHTYSISSPLGEEGEDSMLNISQLVWECWGEVGEGGEVEHSAHYGMMLFDLDQWYKDQMPATYPLESSAFMSVLRPAGGAGAGAGAAALDARLVPASLAPYSHATRLEEHFYPNSLQYNCICLNTSEATVLGTVGVQRQIINSIDEAGPTALLSPGRLHLACVTAGLTPLYVPYNHGYRNITQEDQRRFLLSVALEARLTRFLKRCAHDWATGTHTGLGCTLSFLVEWCWKRALELKENAKELVAPLFTSTILPDRNIMRCLEHCVQQLTQLTGLLDAILTKCCNLVVPDALSEMEEKYKCIGIVSLYLQVVQWFLRVGLLPERAGAFAALPYPAHQLYHIYNKRRVKLQRVQEGGAPGGAAGAAQGSCGLLYIDQLIEHEFGGQTTHEMWLKGGSECGGLYPPPSLYSLLRLYLLPDIAEEHKHSLVLYLLLDYCTVYDEIRYEAVIRRLMQFPTMFGLSNTAIKATQAFWHLDHRDFDFALDQLQCLTGNTLSDWQHRVVLSSLLAQKKTQAALQYLHVRKPAPIQSPVKKDTISKVNDNVKLEDWQCCCNLYLARGLVFEAIDVVRMCVRNASTSDEKVRVLNFFYKGCRNTGQLSKVLQVTLLPGEEEVFIKYLKDCNDTQTSDILIMYYLQQARYLEAEEYNNKLKEHRSRKELSISAESLAELVERCHTRDTLLSAACAALPHIACRVATAATANATNATATATNATRLQDTHGIVPKPMSVYVQVTSPKNTFTYKSTFIQDTIENASETWSNKTKTRKGVKRALEIEETPFICTPKLNRTKSLFMSGDNTGEITPAKRTKLEATSPKTPKTGTYKASAELSQQMATLLDMPEAQSPYRYHERSETGTPHSILKSQRLEGMEREAAASPVDSRYLCDSGDDLIETASNKTNYSDSKHLRFRMPSDSESSSSPPVAVAVRPQTDRHSDNGDDTESEISMESPPKKLATEGKPQARKSYKDNVRARRSLSISVNSSLSDDPNASIESIADIPITLINPRYSHKGRQKSQSPKPDKCMDVDDFVCELRPMNETPRGRRSLREISGQSTPLIIRSRSITPERQDSPVSKTLQITRATRSRSRTPEMSPGSLECIPEQPRRESASAPHPAKTTLSMPRPLRSRSRTPELVEKTIKETTKLSAITEAPVKCYESHTRSSRSRSYTPEGNKRSVAEPTLEPITEAPARPATTPTPTPSPTTPTTTRALRSRSRTPDVEKIPEQPISSPRSLRSRSRTPEVEKVPEEPVSSPRSLRSRSQTPDLEKLPEQPILSSPRSLRSRSKTPEKLLSPKKDTGSKGRKPLSRLVLEANAFAKTKQISEISEVQTKETNTEQTESVIECTPQKASNTKSLIDVTFSPIVNKSILQSSTESFSVTEKVIEINESTSSSDLKPLPAFTTLHEVYFEKSVLQTDESSIMQSSLQEIQKSTEASVPDIEMNVLPQFTPIDESDFNKSVLKSSDSSVAGNRNKQDDVPKAIEAFTTFNETEFDNSVLKSHLSSIAHESNENEEGKYTNISSLMTSDSDIEMVDDQKWKYKIDNQNKDSVIQKEKEKIVEIEREINEIEEDIAVGENSSDEENAEDSSGGENVEQGDSSDEEIVEEENKEESTESEEADDEVSVSDSSDEVICIDDDSDSNAADGIPQNKQTSEELPLTDQTETQTENIDVVENITNTGEVDAEIEKAIENVITEAPIMEVFEGKTQESHTERMIEVEIDQDVEMKVSESAQEQSIDVLNQANISLLTDDNSDINLTYSDDSNHKVLDQLREIAPVEIENNEIIPSNIHDIVDACQPVNIEPTPIEEVTIQECKEIEMTATAPIQEPKDIFAENNVKETAPVFEETRDIFVQNTVRDSPDVLETESFNKNIVETTPMEVITATEDVAETVKTDVTEMSETKNSEIKEMPETKVSEIEEMPETEVNEIVGMPETKVSEIEEMPETEVNEIVGMPETKVSEMEEMPETKVSEIEEMPETKVSEIEEMPEAKVSEIKEMPETMLDNIEEIPETKVSVTVEMPEIKERSETNGGDRKDILSSEVPSAMDTVPSAENIEVTSMKDEITTKDSSESMETDQNEEVKETKAPAIRKRTQSTTSNKSNQEIDKETSENTTLEVTTPSKRVSKSPMPKSRVMPKRRTSKDVDEMDESVTPDETLTPRRRSTRSRSKNIDDNSSVASESSVKSSKSKIEDTDKKPVARKGRKSILNTKTELCVIPEVEDNSQKIEESSEDILNEILATERLTRHQKAMLESKLRPSTPRSRRASVASVASKSETSVDEDVADTHMDRVQLLDKETFDGRADDEEFPRASPALSDTRPRPRTARSASETEAQAKAKKVSRRTSVDITLDASPVRGRRASFNRACEALHTPKGRRPSVDTKKSETEGASPESAEATPRRRARRTSQLSDTPTSELGKRSRRTAADKTKESTE
ncbi:PREDICTED: protein ELYS-like isoform X2 [Papilio polytes]|uniref:protein ELYS-like isoform X2 n=1 Tax=Papilio polytes TaxID=76194 RepID=UPI000675D45C|nr:PREDICTED: protein ELYS-like isoform X2 [Papilio polytes]